jgi:MoxR-like ATPase
MAKSQASDYIYTGEIQPPTPAPGSRGPYPYLPEPDLVEAVNLAIALNRPLLLEGDPGCGKTCLAEALVYELKHRHNLEKWPYYRWDVKSSSRGKEGLYTFDAVGRLRDAQMLGAGLSQLEQYLDAQELEELKARLQDKQGYLELGPLGNAIDEPEQRAVLLIDEVDKADSDFANDLLLEIEWFKFTVPEVSGELEYPKDPKTAPKPIVILTSNREKPLPAPFLRRCIYFYLSFPTGDRLRDIVAQRFVTQSDGIPKNREAFVNQAIAHVEEVRSLLQQQPGSRPPGTSEFLDFLQALWNKPPKEAQADLENLAQRSPLLGLLLKTQADQALYRRKFGQTA